MYKVVLFSTDEVEVVPSRWLNENMCSWPSHLKSTQIIKSVEKKIIPEFNWTQHEIKQILYTTDDLEKANKKRKDAENVSSLSDLHSDVNESDKYKRRKRCKIVESDSDSDSDVYKSRKYLKKNRKPSRSSSTENEVPVVPACLTPKPVSTSTLRGYASSQSTNSFNTVNMTHIAENEVSVTTACLTPRQASTSTFQGCVGNHSIHASDMLNVHHMSNKNIHSVNLEILKTVLELKDSVRILQNDLNSLKKERKNKLPDLPHEIILPLNTEVEVSSLEEILKNGDNKKSLVSYLGAIGGMNTKDFTNRLMQKIFSHELSTKLSWTSINTRKLPLNQYKTLCSVISEAVTSNSDATVFSVESYAKSWLRNASDRNGGRTKRRKSENAVEQ